MLGLESGLGFGLELELGLEQDLGLGLVQGPESDLRKNDDHV